MNTGFKTKLSQSDLSLSWLFLFTEMEEKKFKRGDRVYDERYGNGIIDYSENHLIVEFRMWQYITYDLKGYRHYPEDKEPALKFRY